MSRSTGLTVAAQATLFGPPPSAPSPQSSAVAGYLARLAAGDRKLTARERQAVEEIAADALARAREALG